jgi:hypothetical protein
MRPFVQWTSVSIVVLLAVIVGTLTVTAQARPQRRTAAKSSEATKTMLLEAEARPAKRVEPGSRVEKRILAPQALAGQGVFPIYPIGLGRGDPVNTRPVVKPVPRWVGTKINLHPDAKGDVLAVQKRFATAMATNDPLPKSRTDHFAWLNNTDHMKDGRLRQIGWYGGIVGVEESPNGGWNVKLQIQPWIYSPTDRGALFDNVVETYRFDGQDIQLIDTDAAIPKTALQVFPAAR